ncbi:hypothetical protein COBT_003194, partial [Conglomerata obtusa]
QNDYKPDNIRICLEINNEPFDAADLYVSKLEQKQPAILPEYSKNITETDKILYYEPTTYSDSFNMGNNYQKQILQANSYNNNTYNINVYDFRNTYDKVQNESFDDFAKNLKRKNDVTLEDVKIQKTTELSDVVHKPGENPQNVYLASYNNQNINDYSIFNYSNASATATSDITTNIPASKIDCFDNGFEVRTNNAPYIMKKARVNHSNINTKNNENNYFQKDQISNILIYNKISKAEDPEKSERIIISQYPDTSTSNNIKASIGSINHDDFIDKSPYKLKEKDFKSHRNLGIEYLINDNKECAIANNISKNKEADIFKNINNIDSQIPFLVDREIFSKNCTLKHHANIMKDMCLYINNNINLSGNLAKQFAVFACKELDLLISTASCFDVDYLNFFYRYDRYNEKIVLDISILNNTLINKDYYDTIGIFSKIEKEFHAKLISFVHKNFTSPDFTFNNLYSIICKEACKINQKSNSNYKTSEIRKIIILILRNSSFETLTYYGEICKVVQYLENNAIESIFIQDFGMYYAFLNILNIMVRFEWAYYKILQNQIIRPHFLPLDRLQNIAKNEKNRQIFYKILLFVIRPFVSQVRYIHAWHKIILQELNFRFLSNMHKCPDYKFNHFKISLYQCLDLVSYENDYSEFLFCSNAEHKQKDYCFLDFILKQNFLSRFNTVMCSIAFQNAIQQYINDLYTIIVLKKQKKPHFLYDNFICPLFEFTQAFNTFDNVLNDSVAQKYLKPKMNKAQASSTSI